MKITTLEYFIAVAEAGSIRAAAQKLYLAQPSLTKSLQSMEQELGVHTHKLRHPADDRRRDHPAAGTSGDCPV